MKWNEKAAYSTTTIVTNLYGGIFMLELNIDISAKEHKQQKQLL